MSNCCSSELALIELDIIHNFTTEIFSIKFNINDDFYVGFVLLSR